MLLIFIPGVCWLVWETVVTGNWVIEGFPPLVSRILSALLFGAGLFWLLRYSGGLFMDFLRLDSGSISTEIVLYSDGLHIPSSRNKKGFAVVPFKDIINGNRIFEIMKLLDRGQEIGGELKLQTRRGNYTIKFGYFSHDFRGRYESEDFVPLFVKTYVNWRQDPRA